jgi:hypothetical protein
MSEILSYSSVRHAAFQKGFCDTRYNPNRKQWLEELQSHLDKKDPRMSTAEENVEFKRIISLISLIDDTKSSFEVSAIEKVNKYFELQNGELFINKRSHSKELLIDIFGKIEYESNKTQCSKALSDCSKKHGIIHKNNLKIGKINRSGYIVSNEKYDHHT